VVDPRRGWGGPLPLDGGPGEPSLHQSVSWAGSSVASWARPRRLLLAAVGLGSGDEEGEVDGSGLPLQGSVENITTLVASEGCASCCSDNPDCSRAYMNAQVGHCCARDPLTCCPSYARCTLNGCMRNDVVPQRHLYYTHYHPRTVVRLHAPAAGILALGLIPFAVFACIIGRALLSGGPVVVRPGPALGGGWGGGVGYGGGAVAGAGGAGFLGGLGMGMLLGEAFDRPSYGFGGGLGGSEMYSMEGGGESWMPADGGVEAGEIEADGGDGGGDF